MRMLMLTYNQLRELFDPATFGSPYMVKTRRPSKKTHLAVQLHPGTSRRLIRA